ncbi:hypothetical protein BRC94_10550 [Halobacteriales archaeon QS_5_70_17]|nr:MAG: hypothetical protein BRC94_10550 [Halobacteriales archaeon QS_5_70_17]
MPSRRSLLRSTASGALVAVAGCAERAGEIRERAEAEQGVGTPETTVDDGAVERAGEVGRRLRESVVYLEASAGNRGRRAATGFRFEGGDAGGAYVVTNAHNVAGAGEFTAWTLAGERRDAELVDYVESLRPDVALLRVEGFDAPAPPTGSADALEPGQPLVQVGHPSIMGNWVITVGPFEDRGGFGADALRSHVPGMQGNSGSPLATLDGDVVGLTHGATSGERRGPDDPPRRPTDDDAHTELVGRMVSLHVPVGTVAERISEWA